MEDIVGNYHYISVTKLANRLKQVDILYQLLQFIHVRFMWWPAIVSIIYQIIILCGCLQMYIVADILKIN